MACEYGMANLKGLYEFVDKNRGDGEALRLERTEIGKQFSSRCTDCTCGIDDSQGFYLWGAYNEKGLWQNIYLGMAGYGQHKSLRKRILEELKDERCFIWRSVYTPEELHTIRNKIHSGKYESGWSRSMLKAGTTHIAWASRPGIPAAQVENVERDLIEALNPRANLRRTSPPSSLQQEAKEVFGLLRACIHENRATRFAVYLKGGLTPDEILGER